MQLHDLTDPIEWGRDDVVALRDHAAEELLRRARLDAASTTLADLLEQVEMDGGNPDEQVARGRELAQERKAAREAVKEAIDTAAGAVGDVVGGASRAIGGLLG